MLRLLVSQLLISGDWSSCDCLWATDGLESIVKDPLGSMFDGLIEDIRKEGNGSKAELYLHNQYQGNILKMGDVAHTPIGPQVLNLWFFTSFIARPEYLTML